jgi:hypothetical protein
MRQILTADPQKVLTKNKKHEGALHSKSAVDAAQLEHAMMHAFNTGWTRNLRGTQTGTG